MLIFDMQIKVACGIQIDVKIAKVSDCKLVKFA